MALSLEAWLTYNQIKQKVNKKQGEKFDEKIFSPKVLNIKVKGNLCFTLESNSWTSSTNLKHEPQHIGRRSTNSCSEKFASSTCKHKDRQAASFEKECRNSIVEQDTII